MLSQWPGVSFATYKPTKKLKKAGEASLQNRGWHRPRKRVVYGVKLDLAFAMSASHQKTTQLQETHPYAPGYGDPLPEDAVQHMLIRLSRAILVSVSTVEKPWITQ